MRRMNATISPLVARPSVLEPGAGPRRWLTVLLAVEGLAALAGTITFAIMAPDAGHFLAASGPSSLTGTVTVLLLAGLSAVIAVMAFSVAGSVMRRRSGALTAAAGVQATIGFCALVAGLVGGFDQQIVAGALVAAVGLVLSGVAGRAASR